MNRTTMNKGKWGEDVAEDFLKKKSYKILYRNWRAERGDIDIIASFKEYLIFVEVKVGLSQKYGPPELRITQNKKRQLYKLASIFLQNADKYNLPDKNYRFDVIVIDGVPQNYTIRHYENAFYL